MGLGGIISRAAGRVSGDLTRDSVLEAARLAAIETKDASRSGLLRRPPQGILSAMQSRAQSTMDGAISEQAEKNLIAQYGSALDTMPDRAYARLLAEQKSAITRELGIDLSGDAARVATLADRGGILKRTTRTAAEFAATHPKTALVGGALGTGYLYNEFGEAVEPITNPLGEALSPVGNALTSGLGFGIGGLGTIFSKATGGLEYAGMDPSWAKAVVGIGTFLALREVMSFGIEKAAGAFGLKGIPFQGLVTLLGAGILALNIASAADGRSSEITNNSVPDESLALQDRVPAAPAPALN